MLAADGPNTRRRERSLPGAPALSESFNSKASEPGGRVANMPDEIPVPVPISIFGFGLPLCGIGSIKARVSM